MWLAARSVGLYLRKRDHWHSAIPRAVIGRDGKEKRDFRSELINPTLLLEDILYTSLPRSEFCHKIKPCKYMTWNYTVTPLNWKWHIKNNIIYYQHAWYMYVFFASKHRCNSWARHFLQSGIYQLFYTNIWAKRFSELSHYINSRFEVPEWVPIAQ